MKLAPRFHTAFVEADRWQMYLKGLVVGGHILLGGAVVDDHRVDGARQQIHDGQG